MIVISSELHELFKIDRINTIQTVYVNMCKYIEQNTIILQYIHSTLILSMSKTNS